VLSKLLRVKGRLAVAALLSILCSVATAQNISQFDIPGQPLSDALRAVAGQTNKNILFDRKLTDGLTAKPLKTQATPEEALGLLLEGTGLTYRYVDEKTVTIVPVAEAARDTKQLNNSPTREVGTAPATRVQEEIREPEEIIVTARKREESLLSAPVIGMAVQQQQLEKYQTDDLFALATQVPGLVLGSQSASVGTGVTLRGIGATANVATIDQSVSLNVDGLQLSQSFAYNAAMFDVGQVEVFKGPQALFFGKNSPAGVISLRSADPTDKTDINFRTGYETVAEEKFGEAILSGPVSDSLKLRLAVRYSESDGYFRNLDQAPAGYGVRSPTSENYAVDERLVVRGTLLFNPSDLYDARLKLNYTDDFLDQGGGGTQLGSCPGGLVSFTGLPVFDPNEDCKINRNLYQSWPDPAVFPLLPRGGVPFVSRDSKFGTLEQNLHLGDYTVTSVTGFYEYQDSWLIGGTDSGGLQPLFAVGQFFNRQFTEELRLASDFSGPANFLVGAFYQDGRQSPHFALHGNTGIPGVPLAPILQDVTHNIDIESISGFGQLILDVTDEIELSAGARVTREERQQTQFNVGTPGVPLGPLPLLDPNLSSTNTSPEITLTYRPTEDLTVFGSYKQGYKSGSFNSLLYIDATTPTKFGDEEVKGGEVGLKSRLLDRRLSLNVAAYYYRYMGLQVGATEVSPSGYVQSRVVNAASAITKGIDFDAAYAPSQVEGLTLRVGSSYSHARYGTFRNAPCGGNQTISEGCDQLFSSLDAAYHAQDLSGRPLARAPDWTINSGIDYETPLGQDITLTFGGSLMYSSKFYQNIIQRPGFVQDDFTKVNANIALKGPNNAWEVALIGNNITDEITAGSCANANANGALFFGGQMTGQATGGPAGADYALCDPERGREVWLRLTVRPLEFMRR
jgi:iron complex outermembrane receptor protein